MNALARLLRRPCDCAGRVRYARRSIVSELAWVIGSFIGMRWSESNIAAFIFSSLFLLSVIALMIEWVRGHWRSGSQCRFFEAIAEKEYFGNSYKIRCCECGNVTVLYEP